MPPDPPAPRLPSARPFLLGCCLLLLLLEYLGMHLSGPHGHWTDFRAYYSAGYMLRTQPASFYDFAQQIRVQNSFSPTVARTLFLHPDYEALWLAPFSLLPYRAAYLAYIAFGVLVLAAAFFIARPLFSVKIPYLQPRPGLILLFFLPVPFSILWGQDSVLFLFLCCLTWRQLQRGSDLSAGCVLALALFRFQLAIPIAILTAARRGWRFTAGFLSASVAVVLLCLALVGKAGIANLYGMLRAAALVQDQGHNAELAMGIHPPWMPNLVGLLFAAGTRWMSPHTAFAVVAVASVCLLAWSFRQALREPADSTAFAMALIASVLLSYHFYLYDLGFAAIAMVLLAPRIHYGFLLSFCILPLLLYFSFGIHSFFAIGIPLLGVLLYLGNSRKRSDRPSNLPHPAPLYT